VVTGADGIPQAVTPFPFLLLISSTPRTGAEEQFSNSTAAN
jgi:hypothetical protein